MERLYDYDVNLDSEYISSVGVAEFQNCSGFSQNNLLKIEISNFIEPHNVSNNHIYGNNYLPPFDESALDISMISQGTK